MRVTPGLGSLGTSYPSGRFQLRFASQLSCTQTLVAQTTDLLRKANVQKEFCTLVL